MTEPIPNLLSRRQYQTAMLLIQGKRIKEITRITGTGRSCIQYHLARMRHTFCCDTNFQLGYELRPYLDELTAAIHASGIIDIETLRWPQSTTSTLDFLNIFKEEDEPDQPDEPIYTPLENLQVQEEGV